MNGKKAKALRRAAREAADPTLTKLRLRKIRKPVQLLRDEHGKVVTEAGTNIPIVAVPARDVFTAYAPLKSYRRVLKHMKRGAQTGVRYDLRPATPVESGVTDARELKDANRG